MVDCDYRQLHRLPLYRENEGKKIANDTSIRVGCSILERYFESSPFFRYFDSPKAHKASLSRSIAELAIEKLLNNINIEAGCKY